MHILLTRPLEDCSEMILKFKSLGNQVSHLPLLRIEKVDYQNDIISYLIEFGGKEKLRDFFINDRLANMGWKIRFFKFCREI